MEIYVSKNLIVGNNFYTHDKYTMYVSKGMNKTLELLDVVCIVTGCLSQTWGSLGYVLVSIA